MLPRWSRWCVQPSACRTTYTLTGGRREGMDLAPFSGRLEQPASCSKTRRRVSSYIPEVMAKHAAQPLVPQNDTDGGSSNASERRTLESLVTAPEVIVFEHHEEHLSSPLWMAIRVGDDPSSFTRDRGPWPPRLIPLYAESTSPTTSMSPARKTFALSLSSLCRRRYSPRPSNVSTRTGSKPRSRRS